MDFKDMVRQKVNRDIRRQDKQQEQAKDALERSITKRMQTIMIGALASVEQNFGFLWCHNENRVLTEEEKELKILFDKVRNEILDKGNGQIREIKQDMGQYKVEFLKQMIKLPVIPQ